MTLRILNDATSPFGRKVVVAAIERGVPFVEEFVDVFEAGSLDQVNPLRQIPTLVTADGRGIYDSSIILDYLDALHQGAPLVPSEDPWAVRTTIALADGLMEAVLQRVMEHRRPTERQDEATCQRLESRIERALAALDAARLNLESEDIRGDAIAVACALHYVDFRFSTDWRHQYQELGAWAGEFGKRHSMSITQPSRSAPANLIEASAT